jgi:hypothetical protein
VPVGWYEASVLAIGDGRRARLFHDSALSRQSCRLGIFRQAATSRSSPCAREARRHA